MSKKLSTGADRHPPVDQSKDRAVALCDANAVTLDGPAAEGRFRALLDVLPAAIYVTDADGRITYYNRAAADLAGREPQLGTDEWCVSWRLYSMDGRPLRHDECPMAVALKENRAVRGEEAMLERPDGTRIPFAPYPTPLHDASGKLIGAVNMLVDIRERQAASDARAYLGAIIESSDDAIVSKTLEGIVTSWNRGAEAIFGYSAEEIIGQPITRLFPADRLAEEDVILERIRRGERVDHFETVRRCKDGREINVSVTISPVRDVSGRIVGASKIARDITDRKRAEAALRDLNDRLEQRVAERTRELAEANNRLLTETAERERTEAELLQAQKMDAVGQLVSGLAHDFNNLLAAILGNLELLEMRLSDPHLVKLAQAAARSARHGAKLNEQMLAFSRKQYLSPKPIDLNELVLGTQDLLRRSLGGNVEVTTALADGLWSALVDPHQLELVLLNLAINARDAMPAGGRVEIRTRNVNAGERDKPAELMPGDYVMISVADSGTGMSPEVLARACEPFFTTKEPGKGSGLGLAQVYGLAQQSGGGMRIASVAGKGTTVAVYLPRSLAAPQRSTEGRNAAGRAGLSRRARVLVVDDNEDVRDVMVAYLETLGYQSLQAASGHDALELLADAGDSVDVLLADYAMPGMSGADLARTVAANWPELPIVVITGYADTTGLGDQLDDTVLLHKPFGINELGSAIERAVQRNDAAIRRAKVVPLRPRATG
jgi:PAS domain S-box-containing protein